MHTAQLFLTCIILVIYCVVLMMNSSEFLIRFVLPSSFSKSKYAENGNKFLHFEQELTKDRPEGLQSEIIIGRIAYEDAMGEIHHTPSLLMKVFPSSFCRSSFTEMTFANEIFVYKNILPFYSTLNDSIWSLFPKFYFGSLVFHHDNEDGLLALENLKKMGYISAESTTFLVITHLRLMMSKLGEFHAYSYLAKSAQPQQFYKLMNNLIETHFTVVNTVPKFIQFLHEMYVDILSKDERYAEKVGKLNQIIVNAEDFIADIFTTRNEPMAVLCHGDYLRNNVLFRYDDEKNSIDMKFIDVANMKYCSPVVDLSTVFYMNSNQATRDEYWDELLNVYYESLKNTFPHNTVPSKSQILCEFKRNVLQGYLLAMFFLPAMFRQEKMQEDNWTTGLFSPDYEEYENKPLHLVSSEAFVYFHKKLHVGKSKEAVLDVIIDILNRDFV